MQKTLKVILGTVWVITVAYFFYFENHPYYLESFSFLPIIAYGLASVAVVVGAMIFVNTIWNKTKKKPLNELDISVWKILVLIILTTASILGVQLLNADLAIYNGGTIFQDETSWGVMPEGASLEEGMTEILPSGELVSDVSDVLEALPSELYSSFEKVNVMKGVLISEGKLLFGLIFFMALVIFAYGIGHFVWRKIDKKWKTNPDRLEEFALSTALGLSIYMAVMFCLGIFHVAYWQLVIGIVVISAAISYKDIWELLKIAIKNNFTIKLDKKSITQWVVGGAFIVFCYNLIEIIRPVPIGWDDMSQYLFIPQKITYLKGLLPGVGGMYNWELISSFGAYSGDAMLMLFTNFGAGLLAMIGVYLVVGKFVSKEKSLMLTSFFYTLPTVIFQSSTDLKNDLALLFFVMMAFYAFLVWLEKDKKNMLYLAGVFMGISIGIKITAGMALVIMIILGCKKIGGKISAIGSGAMIVGLLAMALKTSGIIYGLSPTSMIVIGAIMLVAGLVLRIIGLKKEGIKKEKAKQFLVMMGVVILTIVPWVIKNNIIDQMPLVAGSYISSNLQQADINFSQYTEGCVSKSSLGDEFISYVSGIGDYSAGIIDFVKMPWQMTMNEGFTGIYVDITFVFFGAILFIFWYLIEKKDKEFKLIATLTSVYYLLFIFFFRGIPWYGFAGMVGMLILIAKLIEGYEKDSWRGEKILGVLLTGSICLAMVTTLFVKIASTGTVSYLAYAGGLTNDNEFIQQIHPGVLESQEILMNEETTVYSVGVSKYFFAETNVVFFEDKTLDKFVCLLEVNGEEKTLEILQEEGIGYIAFDFTVVYEEGTEQELIDNYEKMMIFGTEYLEMAVAEIDYILFKIP